MSAPSTADQAAPSPGVADRGRWWPLVSVCIAVFMLLIDVTVVNVALPDLRQELGAGFSALQWVIDAYALSLASFQLTSGTVGDRLGRKPIFMGGIALFALASLACGFAPTVEVLIAFRAVQGIGGAVMFANSLAILGQAYTGRDRGIAFGVWGATTGASVAIGPLVGGALTSGVGWRWIFFVNVPIGALALLIAWRRLPSMRPEGGREIDWAGLTLFSAALAALVVALIRGNDAGWDSAQVIGLFTGAVAGVCAFAWREYRAAISGGNPMVDVRLFRRPAFTGAQIAAFAMNGSLFALFLYLTLYLQDVLGYSAFDTGVRLLAVTALTVVAAPIAGRLSAHLPMRLLVGTGLVVVGVGLVLLHGITAASGWMALLAGFMVCGLGSGITNSPLGSLAVGVVERARSGMGAGVNNTFRQVGLATGIAAYGAVFQHVVTSSLRDQLPGAPPGTIGQLAAATSSGGIQEALKHVPAGMRDQVQHASHVAFVNGLNDLFVIAAVVAFVGAVFTFALVRQRDLVSADDS